MLLRVARKTLVLRAKKCRQLLNSGSNHGSVLSKVANLIETNKFVAKNIMIELLVTKFEEGQSSFGRFWTELLGEYVMRGLRALSPMVPSTKLLFK